LELSKLNSLDVLRGLAIGLVTIVVLFSLEGLLGWLMWEKPQPWLIKIVLEGLLVGCGVGFAEELLFRGWLLAELQQDYHPNLAMWISAMVFAGSHFIKPWDAVIHTLPQFPALLLLGLTQVWGKRWRRGRLGLPIGLHGGLVWGYYIINVGNLIKYSGKTPDWVTGVNHNPLQGIMGILFMGGIALWMRRNTQKLL
jgi:membrane protease YdiL (CAAX protease family)